MATATDRIVNLHYSFETSNIKSVNQIHKREMSAYSWLTLEIDSYLRNLKIK